MHDPRAGRKESTVGPWVLGVVLLLLVVWVASLITVSEPDHLSTDGSAVLSLASSAAFSGWVQDSADGLRMSQQPREYVTSALRRMTLAIRGVVSHAEPAHPGGIDRLDAEVSAFVVEVPGADSGRLRSSLDAAYAIVESLAENDAPAPRAALPEALEEARSAVASVDPAVPLEEQLDRIDGAVRAMARALAEVARVTGAP
jgi:hypothetical protein